MIFCVCAGWCVALGGGSALDTLGSQAFTGGIRKTDLSIHLQRCVVLLWALFIPVGVLWFFMEPVLLAIGEPVRLCKDVQDILRILIFAAPGFIAFESLKKYLQCQGKSMSILNARRRPRTSSILGIMRASTLVLIVVWPINLALNGVLVHHTPLGMLGNSATARQSPSQSMGVPKVNPCFLLRHASTLLFGFPRR